MDRLRMACSMCTRALSGGHLWTDLLMLLVDARQRWPGKPRKRVVFTNVYEKPLHFPAGIQTIHREGCFLSFQVPVLRCLHGLFGLIILCLK